ncbi:hypothetical protein [Acaryochloris sp. CCMEE 5410]|uniref:hypothetical protein n=1 Tax=Acaryochloris sp. CCMEE 5410 TaxID=310037 RepID=UPI00049489D3|nr:hypothetical protein [Acaryochloris sp. CCMEE 5410]KAI9134582.1 hypothetical protein ON05_015755 [Acaryochloris sp. CCMEE 5410]
MSNILETRQHQFWGHILRIDGFECWNFEFNGMLPDGTHILVRVQFDDPDNTIVQANFTAIRGRWPDIWPRILQRTEEIKIASGYANVPLCINVDWFELQLPEQPISHDGEWSVMLQAKEAGWLIDFKGWEDFGGQGVF